MRIKNMKNGSMDNKRVYAKVYIIKEKHFTSIQWNDRIIIKQFIPDGKLLVDKYSFDNLPILKYLKYSTGMTKNKIFAEIDNGNILLFDLNNI